MIAAGDVTGHGVSAALVTAAAHTSFLTQMRRLEESQGTGQKPSLKKIVVELNEAIHASASGDATMTLGAAIIDLDVDAVRERGSLFPDSNPQKAR